MRSKNIAPWKKKRSAKRRIRNRAPRDRILIVCEGECTEPLYFRAFPVNKTVVDVDISGMGANTDSLVEKAAELKNEALKNGDPYNQVWCVFDRDSFPAQNFNRAFQLAQNQKIRIAYTNQAFELWYLLHFHFYNVGMSRHGYIDKLSALLTWHYQKNNQKMYEVLHPKQQDAIRNAKKLLSTYSSFNPEKNDPSTTVYRLVEELNRFID